MKRFFIIPLLAVVFLVSACSSSQKVSIKEEQLYDLPTGAFVFAKQSEAYEYTKAKKENDKVKLSKLKEDDAYYETENDVDIYTYNCDDEVCEFSIHVPNSKDISDEEREDTESKKYYVPVEFIGKETKDESE